MIRRIAVAVGAAAIATAGFVAIGTGSASAANEVINCASVKAKVTLTPALTMTPTIVNTTIAGKVKDCTISGGPAGVVLKGGTTSGSIQGTEPGTCDIAELAGESETDTTIKTVWKTKPKGALADTIIVFGSRSGFTLPASGFETNVTGTGAGKGVKVVGDATGDVGKIIKKCYGKDGVPAPPHGKGVTKIKVGAGTVSSQ